MESSTASSSYIYQPLFRGTSRRPSRLRRLSLGQYRPRNSTSNVESSFPGLKNNDAHRQNSSSASASKPSLVMNSPLRTTPNVCSISQENIVPKNSTTMSKKRWETSSSGCSTKKRNQHSNKRENNCFPTDESPSKKPRICGSYNRKNYFVNRNNATGERSAQSGF